MHSCGRAVRMRPRRPDGKSASARTATGRPDGDRQHTRAAACNCDSMRCVGAPAARRSWISRLSVQPSPPAPCCRPARESVVHGVRRMDRRFFFSFPLFRLRLRFPRARAAPTPAHWDSPAHWDPSAHWGSSARAASAHPCIAALGQNRRSRSHPHGQREGDSTQQRIDGCTDGRKHGEPDAGPVRARCDCSERRQAARRLLAAQQAQEPPRTRDRTRRSAGGRCTCADVGAPHWTRGTAREARTREGCARRAPLLLLFFSCSCSPGRGRRPAQQRRRGARTPDCICYAGWRTWEARVRGYSASSPHGRQADGDRQHDWPTSVWPRAGQDFSCDSTLSRGNPSREWGRAQGAGQGGDGGIRDPQPSDRLDGQQARRPSLRPAAVNDAHLHRHRHRHHHHRQQQVSLERGPKFCTRTLVMRTQQCTASAGSRSSRSLTTDRPRPPALEQNPQHPIKFPSANHDSPSARGRLPRTLRTPHTYECGQQACTPKTHLHPCRHALEACMHP